MFFFKLYENFLFLFTLFSAAGLLVLAVAVHHSVRHHGKPGPGEPGYDEHLEPGIPVVLQAVYLGVAVYILVATLYVVWKGVPI